MQDQDRLYDLLRQAADLRAQSVRVRAKADQIVAISRRLVTEIGEVTEVTEHARSRLAESRFDQHSA
jgi:hypothetical protein